MTIDTTFDFTTDTPGYWDGFWERREGWGAGNTDPDALSPTLKRYHKELWSKTLPNGQVFMLEEGKNLGDYLMWNDIGFGSDSIIVSFNYVKYLHMKDELIRVLPDFKKYRENCIRRAYTIGGMIIFPKHRNSMNQARGTRKMICDRWDLTMECIRRYYNGENSPLSDIIESDKAFFDLFVDFKGYVDFFFLQDCVTEDYRNVIFWEGDGSFREYPFPESVEDYLSWMENEMDFLDKRNNRIKEAVAGVNYEGA
ncbi:MAG: hypothetical protein IJP92_07815 [Lachnospiraceae bacterium]|nr:hypothetical protein [Lachnospiraceae bacterium]